MLFQHLCFTANCCVGYVVVEGQMNSTDFVDDISITFLYVSSSDLVLKIINSKNYHFARYKNITNKNAEENVRFFWICHPHARA